MNASSNRPRPAVLLVVMLLLTGSARADELTDAVFRKLHAELQPDPNALWRTISWNTSVVAAQRLAAESKKPLFIWAMDGHPLGCT